MKDLRPDENLKSVSCARLEAHCDLEPIVTVGQVLDPLGVHTNSRSMCSWLSTITAEEHAALSLLLTRGIRNEFIVVCVMSSNKDTLCNRQNMDVHSFGFLIANLFSISAKQIACLC